MGKGISQRRYTNGQLDENILNSTNITETQIKTTPSGWLSKSKKRQHRREETGPLARLDGNVKRAAAAESGLAAPGTQQS